MKKNLLFKSTILGIAGLMTLAACGSDGKEKATDSSSKDGEKVTIKFSSWDEFDQGIIDAFEKENPNINVENIQVPDSDYSQKINTMIIGGNAPDVILSFETDLPRFAANGAIEDLDPYIEKEASFKMDDFIPAVENIAESTGGNYGLPWAYASEILYYNKDMFDEAKVEYPNAEWTWDDFKNAAEKLTVKEGNKTVQWGADAISFRGMWYSMIGAAGDDIVDSDGNLVLGDGLKKTLEFQNELTNELKVSPQPTSGDAVSDLFASGSAAMTRTGSWMTMMYKDNDFNWDIAPLPKEDRAYSTLHTGFYTIASSSKHKEEAWKFINFMMSETGQTMTSEWGNNPSALRSVAEKGAYQNPGKNGPSNWDTFAESAEAGQFGYTLINASVTTGLVNDFDSYLLGAKSIDDIMTKSVPNAQKQIDKEK